MASPLHGCLSLCLSSSLIWHPLILPRCAHARWERKEAAATAALPRPPASWCIQHMDSIRLVNSSAATLALLGPPLQQPRSAGKCVAIAGRALQCSQAWHLQPCLDLCCSSFCSPELPWFKKYQSRLSDILPKRVGGRVSGNRVVSAEQPGRAAGCGRKVISSQPKLSSCLKVA